LFVQLYLVFFRSGLDALPGGVAFSASYPLHLLETSDCVAHVSGVMDRLLTLLWESESFIGDVIAAGFSNFGLAA
jgi:hypothetical protein